MAFDLYIVTLMETPVLACVGVSAPAVGLVERKWVLQQGLPGEHGPSS